MKSVSWKEFYGLEMKDKWSDAKKNNKKVDLKEASKEISQRWKKIKAGEDSEYSIKSSSGSSTSSKSKKKKNKKHNSTKKKNKHDDDLDSSFEDSNESHDVKGKKIINDIKNLLSKLEKLM